MRILLACSMFAAACTAGSAPTGGPSLADQVSAAVSLPDGNGGTTNSATIVLASTSAVCADASANPPIDRAGQQYIAIDLEDVAAGVTTTPSRAGAYTIYANTGDMPPHTALLRSGSLDAQCQASNDIYAQSGTVTLASVQGGVFAGSYDVVLGDGEHLTGSFQPSACPQIATALATSSHRCM